MASLKKKIEDKTDLILTQAAPNRTKTLVTEILDKAPKKENPISESVELYIKRATDKLNRMWPYASSLIMKQTELKRKNYVHKKGNFLSVGQRVRPALPFLFNSDDKKMDRLNFAKWLFERSVWQKYPYQ